MSGPNGHHPLPTSTVDWLFVQLAEGNGVGQPASPGTGFRAASGPFLGWPAPAQASENGWPDPPADLEKVPELREAYRWLLGERQRLEEYTRTQFAAIQQRHQSVLAQHFRNEENLALRTQELNREMTFVAAQAKIIQERAGELARREKALAEQAEKLARAQEEWQRLRESGESPCPDSAAGMTLADWQAETARMRGAAGAASDGLAEVEHALQERQAIWEGKQAEIADRLAQMERRYEALEQAEEAARRRMAELDELENRLTQEFEKQERQLALERRQIETLRARLRLQGLNPDDLKEPGTAGRAALETGRRN